MQTEESLIYEILKTMNRRYTVDHYKNLVETIYQKIDGATLTTDIIVGFPTETEEDFDCVPDSR